MFVIGLRLPIDVALEGGDTRMDLPRPGPGFTRRWVQFAPSPDWRFYRFEVNGRPRLEYAQQTWDDHDDPTRPLNILVDAGDAVTLTLRLATGIVPLAGKLLMLWADDRSRGR